MTAISAGIEDRKTDTGRMKVSSVELTLLDLMRYPHAVCGLDNVATMFPILLTTSTPESWPRCLRHMNDLSSSVSATCWNALVNGERAELMHAALPKGLAVPWVELERSQAG